MELKVQAAGEAKQGQYGAYGSVRGADNNWYVINGDPKQYVGKTLSGMVQDKGKYKVFKVDFVVDEKEQANGAGHPDPLSKEAKDHGKIPLNDWLRTMEEFHKTALKLEPDGPNEGGLVLDRSQARSTMVNCWAIALSNGKIDIEDEGMPF